MARTQGTPVSGRQIAAAAALAVLVIVGAALLGGRPDRTAPSTIVGLSGDPSTESRAPRSIVPSPNQALSSTGASQLSAPASIPATRLAIPWVGQLGWQIQHPSHGTVSTAAFSDAPSYLPGDTFRLAVSTTAARYVVAVYRLGRGMPEMSRSAEQIGEDQPATPIVDPTSLEVRANWSYTYSQSIPPTWPSGIYLAKIIGIAGADAFAIFTVRSSKSSQILFVENTVNDEAYNTWGGTSLYLSTRGDLRPGVHHASAVSLDRPFAGENGAGQLFEREAAFAIWLETNGYEVTYTTDYDLATHPQDQALPKTVVFSGHDEYWGRPLRDWLDRNVLDRGAMNLGVFAANTGCWPVTFRDPSATGNRTVVVYKEAITDPNFGGPRTTFPDGRPKLLLYRNLPFGDPGPGNLPEQRLFGVQWGYIATEFAAYQLASTVPPELLTGTSLQPGQSLGFLVGGEVDNVDATIPTGSGDTVVAESRGFATRHGEPGVAQAVVRRLPSGGRVFAAGTFQWEWGLDAGTAARIDVPPDFDRLTRNILTFLAGE